ncbi:MAG: magnesium-translocating P-type ATPase [Burkholderiales bacterium]
MSRAEQEPKWWLTPLPDLRAELATDDAGLSMAAAAARLRRFGPNRLRERREQPLVLQLLSRFRNPLVIVLLAASGVSALTGDTTDFAIISIIILFSVTLDFLQEHRANRASERLRRSVSVHAMALRDGREQEVPLASIVPGDLVLLAAGDLVPADGRVIAAKDFFVKQPMLTGEPYPVEKRPTELDPTATEVAAADNAVFMGTSVISGSATVLVCRTGSHTEIGRIAISLEAARPPTAFEIGTRQFGVLIMRLTILMVLFVLLVNVVLHRPLMESFLFAVALAVGLTPELLPMVVSVTLARGALRMAKQRVIVKQLASIQNLGSMNVLCTDKTGTLTEARIRLERHVDVHGRRSARALELAYLNSWFETGLRSPLDEAILEHREIDVAGWTKVDEVPFDFERRRISVLVEKDNARLLVVKGAPEDILRLSTTYEESSVDEPRPLDPAAREHIRKLYDELGDDGFRTLGIAWRRVSADHPHAVVSDEAELVFAGLAGFLDPPKESAGPALAALAGSGVAVKIVTGDSERVTQHVCRTLGIPVTGVLTGPEIAAIDDQVLGARVAAVNLFCRVNPAQKNRIILALKARGQVVGYLGDGINDAPSLHSADVGLSVDTAVDVAKEAADMILLAPDLKVLHAGVMEGRRTFVNIMKYIRMGTSSNFGNVFSMAGAALFLPFLPMLPTQILLNNALYDISEIPIPLDQVDAQEIVQPHTWDMSGIRNFMLAVGPVSSLFDFLTFYVMIAVLNADETLFHTGWFIESLATQVLVIFVIRTQGNPLRSRPHPLLTFTSLAVVAFAAWVPFSPAAGYLGFVPPPPAFFLILAAMVALYLVLVQIVKAAYFRHVDNRRAATR